MTEQRLASRDPSPSPATLCDNCAPRTKSMSSAGQPTCVSAPALLELCLGALGSFLWAGSHFSASSFPYLTCHFPRPAMCLGLTLPALLWALATHVLYLCFSLAVCLCLLLTKVAGEGVGEGERTQDSCTSTLASSMQGPSGEGQDQHAGSRRKCLEVPERLEELAGRAWHQRGTGPSVLPGVPSNAPATHLPAPLPAQDPGPLTDHEFQTWVREVSGT